MATAGSAARTPLRDRGGVTQTAASIAMAAVMLIVSITATGVVRAVAEAMAVTGQDLEGVTVLAFGVFGLTGLFGLVRVVFGVLEM
jgi:hypothetical protein